MRLTSVKINTMRLMTSILILLVAYFVFSPRDYADEAVPVAKVVWVKGVFQAFTLGAQSRILSTGSPIYLHDTLVTGYNASAQIVFTDNTLMTFRPASNFYVHQYAYEPKVTTKKTVGRYVMRLVTGGFRTITGLIAKNEPSHYQVNTPVAVIGVRGTDYEVNMMGGQLYMGYYSGHPSVTSGGQTLTLSDRAPYARVVSPYVPPIALIQRPPELAGHLVITPTTYQSASSSSSTTVSAPTSKTTGGAETSPTVPPPPTTGGAPPSSGAPPSMQAPSPQAPPSMQAPSPQAPPSMSGQAPLSAKPTTTENFTLGSAPPENTSQPTQAVKPTTPIGPHTPVSPENILNSFCIEGGG